MHDSCVIGIDIGGTNSRIGAVSLDGELLHSSISSSKQIADGQANRAIQDLADYINEYIDSHVPQKVLAIAVAFPATIDEKREILYSASNLGENAKCRFDGLNIPKGLADKVKAPVFLGKDTDFILYNDINELDIETDEMVAGIYFGTGIGSSFMYCGKTIYGYNGVTGEIGHLPISDNRRKCTCTLTQGCCETVASGWRLIQLRDEHFPHIPVNKIFTECKDHPAIETFVFDMARVIAVTGNLLNSAFTVVGGGVVNMKDFPQDRLKENVLAMLRDPYPRNKFNILFSPAGQNAGILGAAQYLFKTLNL